MAILSSLAVQFADDMRVEHRKGICGGVKAHCPYCEQAAEKKKYCAFLKRHEKKISAKAEAKKLCS